MLKLILARHGESVANQKGIYQGQTFDTGLTARGKNQAKLLAREVGSLDVDVVFTTRLKRALETARIIANSKGVLVETDSRLAEISHGEWEGKTKEDVKKDYPDLIKLWEEKPSQAQMIGGENCYQVANRVMRFLLDLAERYQDKTVLIVGHDLVLRITVAIILGLPFDSIWKFRLDCGGLSLIEIYKNLEGQIVFLNKNDHLKNFLADVDKQAL